MDETEIGETSLRLERTFPVPPARVFKAWKDPEEVAAWYTPGDLVAEVHTWELTPGARFRVSMHEGDQTHTVAGEFLEVVENERIVQSWRWEAGPSSEVSRITIELDAVEGGTLVRIRHEKLEDRASVENHAQGWQGSLANLEARLQPASA